MARRVALQTTDRAARQIDRGSSSQSAGSTGRAIVVGAGVLVAELICRPTVVVAADAAELAYVLLSEWNVSRGTPRTCTSSARRVP